MALQVTKSRKDPDGDITGLCGYGWTHSKREALANLRHDVRYYYVTEGARTVYVRVGRRNGAEYLTTSPDDYGPNNLDNLDNC